MINAGREREQEALQQRGSSSTPVATAAPGRARPRSEANRAPLAATRKNTSKSTSSSSSSSGTKSSSNSSSNSITHATPVLSVRETAERLLALPAESASSGSAVVRWNHYRKAFRVHNGVIRFADIDEEYSFSFVYRGAFGRRLRQGGLGGAYLQGDLDYFIRAEAGDTAEYAIEVEEDPVAGVGAEGLRLCDGPAAPRRPLQPAMLRGSRQVELITQQLLQMDVRNLQDEEARRLREARDLEDILFRP